MKPPTDRRIVVYCIGIGILLVLGMILFNASTRGEEPSAPNYPALAKQACTDYNKVSTTQEPTVFVKLAVLAASRDTDPDLARALHDQKILRELARYLATNSKGELVAYETPSTDLAPRNLPIPPLPK